MKLETWNLGCILYWFGWLSLLDYIDFFLESLTLLLKKLSLWLTSPNLGRLTSGNYFPLVLQNQRWYKQQNKRYTLQQNHLKKNKFFFGYLRFFLYLCIRKRLIRQETALCKKMQIRLEENVHWHIEKSPYLCRRQTELITIKIWPLWENYYSTAEPTTQPLSKSCDSF